MTKVTPLAKLTIELSIRPPTVVFSDEDIKATQQYLDGELKALGYMASTFAFGVPNYQQGHDARINALVPFLPFSYAAIESLFAECYAVMGLTIDQCIDYVQHSPDRFHELAYSLYVTKHWNAANKIQLLSQGLLPVEPL